MYKQGALRRLLLFKIRIRCQRLWRNIQIPLPAAGGITDIDLEMAWGVILSLLDINPGAQRPVGRQPPLELRLQGVTDAGAAAALADVIPVGVGRGNQPAQRITALALGFRARPRHRPAKLP